MSNRAIRLIRHLLGIWNSRKWCLLACLIITVGYGVTSVASVNSPHIKMFGEAVSYTHGWPRDYVRRFETWDFDMPPPYEWNIFSGVVGFDAVPFLIDVGFALGLSLLVTHLWHFHCTRRKPWQFSLGELMIATVVVSFPFGMYLKERSDYERDESYLDAMGDGWMVFPSEPMFAPTDVALPWYYRPLCDLGVTDEDEWSPRMVGWTSYNARRVGRKLDDAIAEVSTRRLSSRCVTYVIISDPALTDEHVRAVCDWASMCLSLNLTGAEGHWTRVTDRGVAYIANHMHYLRKLMLQDSLITDEGVRSIATMRSLEWLVLVDPERLTTSAGLNSLLKLPRIERLCIPEHWVINDATKEEAAHRGIEIVQ